MHQSGWVIVLISATATAQVTLPVPTHIRSGETLALACGRIYSGELDLANLQDVTISTDGDCGAATITPARLVTGWQPDRQPGVWRAPLDMVPTQIELGGQFIALAHHPNTPQTWAKGQSRLPGQLQAPMPQSDLAGATLVWRAADWLIQTRPVTRYENGTLFLASGKDDEFGLLPETEFYVEGKRWMLDSPGEWSYADGWLFVWPPDGKSPEGRTWAAPRARGINASGSRGVRITQVQIRNATLGIDGSDAKNLLVRDTAIINSGEDAFLAGGRGLRIKQLRITGSVENGIRANDDARDVEIIDSQIDGAGMLGMPRRSKGAIVFEQSVGHTILRNRITHSAYIAIRVFRDALVADNHIEYACLRLTDCGGIYTFARDRQPLRTLIERNRISHLAGRMAHAIYLDDEANGVTVLDNTMTDNPGGMQLHNAFNNVIRHNIFSDNRFEQILFNETGKFAAITRNVIAQNRFSSTIKAPTYRLWSVHGARYVHQFAQFDDNDYVALQKDFAEVAGSGLMNYSRWMQSIQMPRH